MTDRAELDLLRDSARGELSKYPDALGLSVGFQLAPGAVGGAMEVAASQGWTAMLLPEALGGLGLGAREAAILAEEVGRSLTPGPFLANLVLIPALAAASAADWLIELAGEVGSGESIVAISVLDNGTGPKARRLVEHGSSAGTFLRLAVSRHSGAEQLTITRLEGVRLKELDPFDPTCPVAELQGDSEAREALVLDAEASASVLGLAQIWIAAELLGVAERTGEMSIAHACTRRQFGTPIGSNQGIKHRIVDDYVLRRNAAALVGEAAEAWDARREDRSILAHSARAAASQAALSSTSHCIQVHGAVGFSYESIIHLAYKRARRLACTLGDERRSRSLIATQLVSERAA